MISYNGLGSNGRFGNQMFQYAALRGIAAKNATQFLIPPPDHTGDSDYALFQCFEMSSVKQENLGYLDTKTNLVAGQFHFNEAMWSNCPDNVNLHDYFQSERYFSNVEDIIRNDFTFKKTVQDRCDPLINSVSGQRAFIHIRRGDYVNQPENHPALPISYYQQAVDAFPSDCTFLVFSDDMDWVRNQQLFADDRFKLAETLVRYTHTAATNDGRQQSLVPFFDLYMMSKCSGAIIANSSFSWWGAWLIKNPTLPIIAPMPWFGPNLSAHDLCDLLPNSWTTINWQ